MPDDDMDDVISSIRSSGRPAEPPAGTPQTPIIDTELPETVRRFVMSSTDNPEVGEFIGTVGVGKFLMFTGVVLLFTGIAFEFLDRQRTTQ